MGVLVGVDVGVDVGVCDKTKAFRLVQCHMKMK